MRIRSLLSSLTLTAFLLAGLLIQFSPQDAAAQVKKGKRFSSKGNCLECHKEADFAGGTKHKPFAENKCLSCHKPHGIVGVLRLKDDIKTICLECHDQTALGLDRKILHKPVADGDCTVCHNPHAGEGKGILKEASPQLCYGCHDQSDFERVHKHKPLEKGCFSCHEIHGSDHKGLLVKDEKDLCRDCHDTRAAGFAKAHATPLIPPISPAC
ncbi:MAG: hypothetical protein CVT49_00675 [candidate division Zixibacteria bacterium HGW-Zixibacteria-1]|nr:MAG: hypothetical protein CVT49_00675 [candidate division Zixibacteria bacterium HGW-Zixibacteria-1]